MHKQFMTAAEVAETMGVSLGKAYELIYIFPVRLLIKAYIPIPL